MEQGEICEYCQGFKHLSERDDRMSNKGDFYPGIDVYVENNTLEIEAVPNTYEPGYIEKSIEINYCPMCGRRIEEK